MDKEISDAEKGQLCWATKEIPQLSKDVGTFGKTYNIYLMLLFYVVFYIHLFYISNIFMINAPVMT